MLITKLFLTPSDTDLLILYGVIIVCVILFVMVIIILKFGRKRITDKYTDISDPVISYEYPIPTNGVLHKITPTITKMLSLNSFVEPNKRAPGYYYDEYPDILLTNGIYSFPKIKKGI